MKRRTFLVGTGSAAIGGSALLGSGAFSKVESQRDVTIQVAEDPNAYLGMDKCRIDGSETPNSSYAHLDGNGHLELLMNPDNPTINSTALGEGINSDSTTWFDNVFQICNQGKEDVCLWIEDDEDWPRVSEGEPDEGEREVDFYLGGDDSQSLVGEENAIVLPLGECVCVGLLTRSYDLAAGDEVLEDLDNEIRIIADVDGDCFPGEEAICDIWGIQQTAQDSELVPIATGAGVGPGVSVGAPVQDLTAGGAPSTENYPNGLAHTGLEDLWYFADDAGVLWTHQPPGTLTEYDELAGGTQIAGAAYHDEAYGRGDGPYYFIPQGGSDLKTADVTVGNSGEMPTITTVTDLTGLSGVSLGDIAIDRDNDVAYISAVDTDGNEGVFMEVDLTNPTNQTIHVDGVSNAPGSDTSAGKQIAFGLDENSEKQLYAHEAAGEAAQGTWYKVDTSDGSVTQVDETDTFTDLAQCGPPGDGAA